CGGNKTTAGNLDRESVYLSSGSYNVTTGELWDTLQWSASTNLTNQKNTVVLDKYVNKITAAMKNDYASLTEDEKKLFAEGEYDAFVNHANQRLADYVVQDVFNLSFETEDYWDSLEKVDEKSQTKLIVKYADEMFTNYGYVIDKDELTNKVKDKNNSYFTDLAKSMSDIYYISYAKELLAEAKITENVTEADNNDTDADDDKIGYFSKSDFTSEFKSKHEKKYDVNVVMIRFADTDEFNETLRAFGLKVSNSKIYFVGDSEETSKMTYNEYCDYYDDLTTTQTRTKLNVSESFSPAILGIYIEMYNYIYGGYRKTLSTALETSADPLVIDSVTKVNELNDLRKLTEYILHNFSQTVYDQTVTLLNTNNQTQTLYSSDDIEKIGSGFKTYIYETLDIKGTNYSTSSQSYNSSQYIAYKFDEEDHDTSFDDYTDDDIITYVLSDEQKELFNELHYLLIRSKITESNISTYLKEETDKCEIKIFNDPVEISYSVSNTSYSKTVDKAPTSNTLATIKYNDNTWNVNVKANAEDSSSVKVAGKTGDEAYYGLYDELEKASGKTTAIDLLCKKMVKDSDAYKKLVYDKDRYDLYIKYIENLLYNFSNGQAGYDASIGKYNYLMLNFHNANIDDIVKNTYLVQAAEVQLLIDYSSNDTINFVKKYSDIAYDIYFSISGKRVLVYLDCDDDGEADEIPADTTDYEYKTWSDKPNVSIDLDGDGVYDDVNYEQIAKYLVYSIYNEVSASTETHSTYLSTIVDEIKNSAKVEYDSNPILEENKWAKYRKVGLNVSLVDYSATNTSTDLDFALKQRLYDYSRGYSEDENGNVTAHYQYFIGDTTPTEYIEPLSTSAVNVGDSQIVKTKDGYNLILVSTGTKQASAKYSIDDHDNDLLKNIVFKYNDEYIVVSDVFNEKADNDKLNANQIKVFLLESVTKGTANLLPSDVTDAVNAFLSPVVSRLTGDETQLVLILEYINSTGSSFTFGSAEKDADFEKVIQINKNQADDYLYLTEDEDTTGTCNSFPSWWDELNNLIGGNN
nr:hypothetical protein [Acholeplasmatales bacterium]